MASIIKKEIRVPEGTLTKMCKEYEKRTKKDMNIGVFSRKLIINDDTMRRFDKGQRSIKFETWEKICNFFEKDI